MKWDEKKILITGAAGFIGSNLLKKISNLTSNIVIIDDFSTGFERNLKQFRGEIIRANVAEKNILSLLPSDVDYIFHFGASCSIILFNKDPQYAFSNTINGFHNIMEYAYKINARKVIYPSSGSVYGRVKPPQKETNIPKPINLYGLAKYNCEIIGNYYQDKIENTGLRIFAGYGPGEEYKKDFASPISIFLNSILKNENPIVYDDGKQSRDFVYIDDIIDSIIRSAEKKCSSIINVGSGDSYSFNNVIFKINSILDTHIIPIYINKPVNYLEETKADITLLRNELNINPLNLDQGLKKFIKYLNDS